MTSNSKIATINYMKKTGQISFDDFRMTTGRGGPREGAGRPAVDRPIVHHVKRPDIPTDGPIHITLRVQKDVPSLRCRQFVDEFRCSLREACVRLSKSSEKRSALWVRSTSTKPARKTRSSMSTRTLMF